MGGGGRTVSLTIDIAFKEGKDEYPVAIYTNAQSVESGWYYEINKDNPSLTIDVNNKYLFAVVSSYPFDVPLENNNVSWDLVGMTSQYIYVNNLDLYTYLASINSGSTSNTAYLKLTFY